jgi:hypothetical protein
VDLGVTHIGARRRPGFAASLLALAVLLGGTAISVQAEAAFIPSAVTFKVDDAAKTITVTAKVAFYNRSCSPGASCEVPAEDVSRIVKAIESLWNNGSKVKCYTLVVKVEARAVGGQGEAGQGEVDIGLDYGPVAVRAFVHGVHHGDNATNPLSGATDDRVEAVHDPAAPTTWPAVTRPQTYAHEFGHILGLDDNYQDGTVGPLPGTAEDLMFWNYGSVTDEMAKRVVERSGQVDLKKLLCGWTFNGDTPIGQHRGVKCDGLGGEWTIQGLDTLAGAGDVTTLWNVTINATTLAGTYTYEKIQTLTGSVTTANSSGKARIALNDDGSVLMYLDAAPIVLTTHTSVGSATVTVPGQALKFPWETDTGGACP